MSKLDQNIIDDLTFRNRITELEEFKLLLSLETLKATLTAVEESILFYTRYQYLN